MLDYRLFKEINDLFASGHHDKARRLLMEVQSRSIALRDEISMLKIRLKTMEDALHLARSLYTECGLYWLRTSGVTLGPFWAVGAAFTTSLVRNMLGTGSLFAFPGSMFGALLDGIAAMLLPKKYKIAAALAEPVGTGVIGAWVSAVVVAPFMGKSLGFAFFATSFLMSCVPGAAIGAAVLWCLRKRLLLAGSAGVML